MAMGENSAMIITQDKEELLFSFQKSKGHTHKLLGKLVEELESDFGRCFWGNPHIHTHLLWFQHWDMGNFKWNVKRKIVVFEKCYWGCWDEQAMRYQGTVVERMWVMVKWGHGAFRGGRGVIFCISNWLTFLWWQKP